jgi:hypothetical protein
MPLFISLQVAPPAQVAPQPPIQLHRFTTSDEGWLGLGDIAKVSRVSSPRSAIEFGYTVDKRNLNLLVRPFEPGALAGAQRLRFVLKTDTDTPIAIIVEEKEGGRWTAVASVPKETWQTIELAPSDFTLARDSGDPVDTNGKLDVDKISGVSILDLHQFFVRAESPALQMFVPVTPGPRTLWLSEFLADSKVLPLNTLDGLTRPQLGWMAVAGLTLKRATVGSPLSLPALEASYSVAPTKVGGMLRPLPTGALTGKLSLNFTAAVLKSTTLLVQLEDELGGKANATVEIPGVRVPKKVTLALSDFKPSDDSKRDKLDLSRVKQVLILDISGLTESVEQANTLWLANLEAK